MWSRKSESRAEIAALEQLADENTQPDFHLIHPGGMLGRVVEHHLVGWVMQKGRPAFHRLQDAAFALDAQRFWRDAFPFSHPAHQGLGLMNVQIIQHDVPLERLRITGDQVLQMRESILFGARGSPGRFDDVPGDDIEIDEPGQRAMPDVLEFPPQHMTGLHRQVGMLAFDGLHAGQFVHADAALAVLGSLFRLGIHLTALDDLFVSARICDLS